MAAPPAKRAKRAAGAAEGMQFFLQLQRNKPGAADGEPEPAGAASSSSSGGDTAEALEAAQRQDSVTVHAVELPPMHAQLLRLLRQDEARVVRSAPAPGVPADMAQSPFLSTAAIQQGLEQAAGAVCEGVESEALHTAAQAAEVLHALHVQARVRHPNLVHHSMHLLPCRRTRPARASEGLRHHGR